VSPEHYSHSIVVIVEVWRKLLFRIWVLKDYDLDFGVHLFVFCAWERVFQDVSWRVNLKHSLKACIKLGNCILKYFNIQREL